MQRDRGRLTPTDLEAARRRLEDEDLLELRYALKRLRRWEPPSVEDAVRWAVEEILVLEGAARIWPSTGASATMELLDFRDLQRPGPLPSGPRDFTDFMVRALLRKIRQIPPPPRGLEVLGFRVLEALQERPWRFLRYTKELERRVAELKDAVGARWKAETSPGRWRLPPFADLMPGGRTMPSRPPAGEGWWLEAVCYGCLWGGPHDDGPAQTSGEYFRRAREEGVEDRPAHEMLEDFSRRRLIRVSPAEDPLEAKLELVELVDPASLGL